MSNKKIKIDHELKCLAQYYAPVRNGEKQFECRKDDRNFEIGQNILLHEVNDNIGLTPTGRNLVVQITYKLSGERWGIKKGYCVLGVKIISL